MDVYKNGGSSIRVKLDATVLKVKVLRCRSKDEVEIRVSCSIV